VREVIQACGGLKETLEKKVIVFSERKEEAVEITGVIKNGDTIVLHVGKPL